MLTDTETTKYELPSELYRKHLNVENEIGSTRLLTFKSTRFEESNSIKNTAVKMVIVKFMSFKEKGPARESLEVEGDTRSAVNTFSHQEVERRRIITRQHLELDKRNDEEAQKMVDVKKNVAREKGQPKAKRREDQSLRPIQLGPCETGEVEENLNTETIGCRWPKRQRKQRDLRTPGVTIYVQDSYKFAKKAKLRKVKNDRRAPKRQRKQASVNLQGCRWPKRQRKQRDLKIPDVTIYVPDDYTFSDGEEELQKVKNGRHTPKRQREQPNVNMQDGYDDAKLQGSENTIRSQIEKKQNTGKQTIPNRRSAEKPLILPFTLLSGSWT